MADGSLDPDHNPASYLTAAIPGAAPAESKVEPPSAAARRNGIDTDVIERHRGPDQKVTLQAWLAGRAHLVAPSHERDLDPALAEVRRDLIRQIEDERSRREPRKRRKTRYRTS